MNLQEIENQIKFWKPSLKQWFLDIADIEEMIALIRRQVSELAAERMNVDRLAETLSVEQNRYHALALELADAKAGLFTAARSGKAIIKIHGDDISNFVKKEYQTCIFPDLEKDDVLSDMMAAWGASGPLGSDEDTPDYNDILGRIQMHIDSAVSKASAIPAKTGIQLKDVICWVETDGFLCQAETRADGIRDDESAFVRLSAVKRLIAAPVPSSQDPIVEMNVELLRKRSAVGVEKYGTTMADSKLPLRAWLNHALEESLDHANYLQAAMQTIDAETNAALDQADAEDAERFPEQHAQAAQSNCETCGGAGVVDDGEIDCYKNGEPFANGPVKCVKDCPDCGGTKVAPAQPVAGELPPKDQ